MPRALVMHHDDGAIRPIIPDLIELGVDILNPIRHNCPGMELAGLKRHFGNRLCCHGGVDHQDVLPHGSVEDVRREVRDCLVTLGAGGGYILAPCHNIQPVTPIENVVAMYETAWSEGWYQNDKSQIPSSKLQTNLKLQDPNTKPRVRERGLGSACGAARV